VTPVPNREAWGDEGRPRRGRHLYRNNAFGLRGGAWSPAKPPGTVRGVVVGDSMVYGSGVDEGDTLPVLLQRRLEAGRPAGRIEVLNLGVPGHDLAGYVRVLDAGTRLAAPDFAVVCLFLPNDFGSFEQGAQAAQVGLYSFSKFLLGTADNPYTLVAMRSAEPQGDAALAILAARVAELREAARGVPLYFFLYSEDDPRWVETTRAAAGDGAVLVTHPPFPDDCFIPDDGHPTAIGNRRFAEIIAEALIDGGAAGR
jgi:lysophospholipase L1-like esterase